MDVSTKIFTRWVNQKLRVRGIVLNDATKDLADGNALVNLVEVLSEKSFGKKLADTKGMRVRQIDNVNNVLKFVWSTGVSLDIKPSAENIVNGEAKPILGLLWAIMKRYLVFTDAGDDEGKGASVSVADSLQGWFQIQLAQYRNVEIKDLTKSFHNGLALCALIHKYRPKLVPYETLDAKAGSENLKVAFAAAEKYFGLEQYLTPEELKKLDDKGMVVYLSEYYYGVAAQRKIDKAGIRIGKLIKFTQTNDDQKARYIDGARKLRARIAELETIMADRTIDNSLERAKARLEDFFKYKTSTKGTTIDNQYLELESSFNQLAMRLSANHRPAFTPDAELTLHEIKAAMKALEQSEQTTKLHLHEELNRQVRLATLNSQHQRRFDILSSWFDSKRNYLETKETVDSVGAAQSNLSTLNALASEAKELAGGSLVELKKLGAQLIEAKYEFTEAVQKREESADGFFASVESMRAAKLLVLEDHLKREQYKQQVTGWNARHVTAGEAIQQWVSDKRTILSTKAEVASISDAEVQLSLLRAFQPEKKDLQAARLPPFEKLGAQLLEAKYSTEYSTFAFEGDAAGALKARTDAVHAAFPELDQLYEAKLEVLTDDLAREKFKERLRQDNRQHNAIHSALVQWANDKKAYLEKKDDVNSVADAQLNLATLNAYEAEKKERTGGDFSALKRLGASIVSDKYETKLSSYVFDAPQDVQAREAGIDEIWGALDGASAKKRTVLDDDLARETFRERLGQDNETHKAKHKSLLTWVANKKAYLEQKETATSVTGAHSNLGTLSSYEADENDTQSSDVKALKQIGAGIVSERFTSELSSYQFATPEEIADRESSIDAAFTQLRELAVAKKQVLEADLAREIRKEELRLQFVNAAADFQRWVKERVEEAASTHFGYALQTVEAFGAVLDESDKAIADTGKNRKQADTSAIWAQLTELGVTEIGYSNESPETIQQGWQAVEEALAKRRAAYGAELDRHKTNDQNGRELAGLVDPMAKEIETHKATITDSKDTLANQLAFVDQRIYDAKDESRLISIEKLQKALDDGGVANNPYSMLSALDARFMWEQYGNFLNAKKKSIEDEIQANKYRGVTQAQVDEINQQFKQFDTTGDGRLDRMEMKTCLFSLNDERPAKEIKAIMAKYEPLDDPNHINHEGFMTFMLNDLGDQDTKEEIINSFAMVMGEKPVFLPPPPAGSEEKKETPEEKEKREKEEKERKFKSSNRVEDYMDEAHVTYFRSTAPPLDDGFDYFAWTETMFAR